MSENPKIVSVGSLETVNGSHEFTIQGYSLTKGMGIGNYIASDTFTVGGYEWAVYFYPNGIIPSENSDTYVSFFIALVSEGSDVRALFELTMFDQTGRERHKVHSHFDRIRLSSDLPLERHKVHSLFDPYPKYLPYTLKWRGSKWGYRRYYRREMLETSDFLKNDCLKIKCTVGVVVGTVPRPRLHSGNVQESEHNTTTSPAEKRERDATEEDGTADNFSIKPPFVKLKITLKIQLKKRERDATEEDVIAVC